MVPSSLSFARGALISTASMSSTRPPLIGSRSAGLTASVRGQCRPDLEAAGRPRPHLQGPAQDFDAFAHSPESEAAAEGILRSRGGGTGRLGGAVDHGDLEE